MKKYMIADLVKATREEILAEQQKLADSWNVTIFELECMQEISDNEADFRAILETAEALGVGPCDIDEGDVETYLDMGRELKGELESSIGPIQWIYDNELKAFIVYIALRDMKCGSGEVLYKLDKDQMKDWINSDSMGEYYNDNIRSQIEEDPRVSCGCCENLCEPQDIADFKQKHSSIS